MTAALVRLLGRLPIGWMQLVHNRPRLFAAIGGVTFANVLIFMQLGFMNALFETSVLTQRTFDAQAAVVSSDFRSLREANPIPRVRMLQALACPGVADATPLYLGTMVWIDPASNDTTNFRVIGVVPEDRVFTDPELQRQLRSLAEPDTALIDRRTRDLSPRIEAAIRSAGEMAIEAQGRTLRLRGAFSQGASFDVDGTLIVSEQTFLRLFANRRAGSPNLVLLRGVESEPAALARAATRRLVERDVKVLSKSELIEVEQRYQASQTPIGFVFGFGVAIGMVVGLVMVYQVLSTDVQDHLPEYATFKAIGYASSYFLALVFEEALCLAVLGFVPGLSIALVLYRVTARATALPIWMPWTRPLFVLVLTCLMCVASGAVATRRLDSADPADLF